jgi:hypothetical protein
MATNTDRNDEYVGKTEVPTNAGPDASDGGVAIEEVPPPEPEAPASQKASK